jgi:imidazole glycerol-phosphate synthase subunit HisH
MNPCDVVVVDYGVGNLLSVRRGLEYCGASVVLTDDPATILDAKRVVLPGVGAFGDAMEALEMRGLVPVLKELAQRDIHLLGICLGMQLLFNESEEFGLHRGLGVIAGTVRAIPASSLNGEPLKIPHIGWNGLFARRQEAWEGTCLSGIHHGDAMYFVHSFMADPADEAHCLAVCDYGGHSLTAVVKTGQVTGCQFHPEKSGPAGLKILRKFCES